MVDFFNYFLFFVGEFVSTIFGFVSYDGYSLGYFLVAIFVLFFIIRLTIGLFSALRRSGGSGGDSGDT